MNAWFSIQLINRIVNVHKNIYTLAALLREKIVEGNYASQHCSAAARGWSRTLSAAFLHKRLIICLSNNWGKRKIKKQVERDENSLWNLKPPRSPDPGAEECGLVRQISPIFPQPWSTDKPTTNNSSNHSKQHHCHLILVQPEGLVSPFLTIVAPQPGTPGATGRTFLSLWTCPFSPLVVKCV